MRVQRLAVLQEGNLRRRRVLLHSPSNTVQAASLDAAMPLSEHGSVFTEAAPARADHASVRSSACILLVALALGWAADFLFYRGNFGVNVPIFVALLLLALFAISRFERVRAVPTNLLLLVLPLLFFAVMVFVRANTVLTFLNMASILVLLTLAAYFFAAGRIERLGLLGYPTVAALVGLRSLFAAGSSVVAVGGSLRGRRPSVGVAVPVLRGILVAAPVLILFAALLASADSVFAKLFEVKFLEDLPDMVGHLFFILPVAWVLAGGFVIALDRGRGQQIVSSQVGALPGALGQRSLFGFIEGATILGLVNALFAVFAWIQFTNFFFGQPTDMPYEEYREYVRGGFGQLLLVCVLTMGLILGVRLFARADTPRHALTLQLLSTVMVALTFVMLLSAYWRMEAWESVEFYINTELRIYVRAFIVWLGLVFAWLTATMWLRRDRFAIGAFIGALGFLVTINLANPDADVATSNLKRNDELSIRYLYLLSDDAVPALVQGLEQTNDVAIKTTLRNHLAERLRTLEYQRKRDGWQSYHVSKEQAYATLDELRRAGKLGVTDSRP